LLIISIDGACRRNGKPNCVSSGGVFIQHVDSTGKTIKTDIRSNYEYGSTNQRGELLALLTALDYVSSSRLETQIITDSEYLFNAMTKQWYKRWSFNSWKTAIGEDVKNADIWREIAHLVDKCEDVEIAYYHIKGHCIPFGTVTADKLLDANMSGNALYRQVLIKYDTVYTAKRDNLSAAQDLSLKNNGYYLPADILRKFVASNVVADAIATAVVNDADRKI
jgi:ribonuclease HI